MDLVLSCDLPLHELVPTLLGTGLVDEHRDGSWTLASHSGQVLAADRTLAESGVVDGEVLVLRPVSEQTQAPRRVIVRPDVPAPGSPIARRLQLLPAQPTLTERLRRGGGYLDRLDVAVGSGSLRRCVTIAVVSPKGGTGKSTVSVLLAALFARLRGDRVVVLDGDADYGSLGPWLAGEDAVSVLDVGAELRPADAVAEELAVGPDGLWVCPAPRDPALMAGLDRDHYARAIARLQESTGVLVVDCGAGLGQPGTQAAILASDQIVLVSDAEPATVAQAADVARLLRNAGPPVSVVINRARLASNEAAQSDALFAHAAALSSVCAQRTAARALSCGEFTWEQAPRSWQRELREVAAALVSAWPQLGLVQVPAAG